MSSSKYLLTTDQGRWVLSSEINSKPCEIVPTQNPLSINEKFQRTTDDHQIMLTSIIVLSGIQIEIKRTINYEEWASSMFSSRDQKCHITSQKGPRANENIKRHSEEIKPSLKNAASQSKRSSIFSSADILETTDNVSHESLDSKPQLSSLEKSQYNEEDDFTIDQQHKIGCQEVLESSSLMRENEKVIAKKSSLSKVDLGDGTQNDENEEEDMDEIDEWDDEQLASRCSQIKEIENMRGLTKKEKQNVVKNFVKAFKGYLTQWGNIEELIQLTPDQSEESLEKIRVHFNNYIKKQKFNNMLMRDLMNKGEFKELFMFFLENRATQWLQEQSHVMDKHSHQVMLEFYIRAISDPQCIEEIKVIRGRRAMNNF